jgi:Ca-activated chloride channel family protein
MLAGFITVTCATSARATPLPAPQKGDVEIPGPPASLRVITKGKNHGASFPLRSIQVQGRVVGTLAEVEVAHAFENPFGAPMEATYTFPLPQNAAVDAMQMEIGDRVIRAQLKTRQDARKTYEAAKKSGQKTALLEQERPNIFTQSVANIEPGQRVTVRLTYHEVVRFEEDTFELVVPTTVGPRFVPGTPKGRSGHGIQPNTDTVPDASRITPAIRVADAGQAPALSIEFAIAPGLPVHKLISTSHGVDVAEDGGELRVVLSDDAQRPNKDFILRYQLGGAQPMATVLAHKAGGSGPDQKLGHVMLQIQPPLQTKAHQIRSRELVFVVDNSGSMGGQPIEAAKNLMRMALKQMRPDDAFRVLRFSEVASSLAPGPLLATEENVRKGLAYVDAMHGMGGTMMIEGIKAALDPAPHGDRVRHVLFLTDGYIGNDKQIIDEVKKRVGQARLFSLGVGSSPNRYLLERMAQVGRGGVQYVGYNDNAEALVGQFYRRIESPIFTDIEVDWGGLSVRDQNPVLIADLFEGQPLTVFSRYAQGGNAVVQIKGRVGNHKVTLPIKVSLPDAEEKNEVIATLWARREIEALEMENINPYRRDNDLEKRATEIALEYEILSAYTSFVAVEEEITVNPNGERVVAVQPVELPEGMESSGLPQSTFTRTHIPPGDPVLSVRAAKDARRVWAYFPFGERKALRWDDDEERWYVRFLVPKGWPDGVYQVRIVVEEKDGKRRSFEIPYTLDGEGPDLHVRVHSHRIVPGQGAMVSVRSDEKLKRLGMKVPWQAPGQADIGFEEDGGRHVRWLKVPGDLPVGSHTLRIVGVDLAGNSTMEEIVFQVQGAQP